jgi:hypothetical protein
LRMSQGVDDKFLAVGAQTRDSEGLQWTRQTLFLL